MTISSPTASHLAVLGLPLDVGHTGVQRIGMGGVEVACQRDSGTRPDRFHGFEAHLGSDEVEGAESVVRSPTAPVRESGEVLLDLLRPLEFIEGHVRVRFLALLEKAVMVRGVRFAEAGVDGG